MDKKVVAKFIELAIDNNCRIIFNVSGVTFTGLPLTDEIMERRGFSDWSPNISSIGESLMLYNVIKVVSPLKVDKYETMFFDYSKIDSITLSLFEQLDD
ncbi:TPA: hypothetical protein ACK0FJ_002134 [Staphylococcus aureus]